MAWKPFGFGEGLWESHVGFPPGRVDAFDKWLAAENPFGS
jgi:hypothetical protein